MSKFDNPQTWGTITKLGTTSPTSSGTLILENYMGMGQNLVPLVNIKIAGKWMFIPLKIVLIGIDP